MTVSGALLIAQVSDVHLHSDPAHVNHERFARTLDHLLSLDPVPDLLILSGDLSDSGEEQSYRHLRKALERWPGPVHLMVGNHDDRGNLATVFADLPGSEGFTQYSVDAGDLRLILLDTTEKGRQGGAFCSGRADWLRRELGASDKPAVLVMHHPPVNLGLDWIDPAGASWVGRFAGAIEGGNVAAILAGHVHSATACVWNGVPVMACPSTSSDLSLIFAPMDNGEPDERPLVERGDPAFALHRWSDGRLTSFFGRCPQQVIARWDQGTRDGVAAMLAEQAS